MMISRFVYIFCMFLFVNVTAVDGEYTRAFKDEVTGYRSFRNLICRPVNKGGQWNHSTYTGSVEVGHSYGPGGRTTHYENRQIPTSYQSPDRWECSKCKRMLRSGNVSAPTVQFSKDGDTEVMSVNSWFTSPPCFTLPEDNGDKHSKLLRKMSCRGSNWEQRLGSMWESARNLDSSEGKTNQLIVHEPCKLAINLDEDIFSTQPKGLNVLKGTVYKVESSCVIQ